MKNFYKHLLSITNLLILLFGLFAATCFGQNERTRECKETNYSCRTNNYLKTVASKCKADRYDYDCFIVQFTKIIESYPTDAAAYFIRGQHSIIKEPDRAILD